MLGKTELGATAMPAGTVPLFPNGHYPESETRGFSAMRGIIIGIGLATLAWVILYAALLVASLLMGRG